MKELIDKNQERYFLGDNVTLVQETKDAIYEMYEELKNQEEPEVKEESRIPDFHIAKGSKAYYLSDVDNDIKEEVTIIAVHKYDIDNSITYELQDNVGNEIDDEIPADLVIPIPGVSLKARFRDVTSHKSINTGETW